MKRFMAVIVILMVPMLLWAGETITKDWGRGERGYTSNGGTGEIKTLWIRQVRVDTVNDVNALEGQQAFTDESNRFLKKGINGWLDTVSLKPVGTDANGVVLTLKGMTTGLTYFSGTIYDCNRPYVLTCSALDANQTGLSIPVNEIIDANWGSNDYNDLTIFLNFKTQGD